MTSEAITQENATAACASSHLEVGKIYSREDLRVLFQITAAGINNGIFKPQGFDSVWLFVTESKTPDRTQYHDLLDGNVLKMDGQLMGRTDKFITEHSERGLELLVFYRKKKNQHPGYGFVYEGRFLYADHAGAGPTKFVLHREMTQLPTLGSVQTELETQAPFAPTDLVDARKRILATIVRRQGQGAFRKTILNAYSSRCAVTGCAIESLLEAAHIVPYLGTETNVVNNGLLLRADIHTLFDLGLLWIEPDTMQVGLAAELKASEYEYLANRPVQLPDRLSDRPSLEAVRAHWQMRKAR